MFGELSVNVELAKLSKPAFKKYLDYAGSANDYAKVLKTVDDSQDMTKLKEQLERLEKAYSEQRKIFFTAMVDDALSDQEISTILSGTSGFANIEIVSSYISICRKQPMFMKQFHKGRMYKLIDESIGDRIMMNCSVLDLAIKAYSLKNSGNDPRSLNDIVDFLEQGKEAILDPWGQTYQFKSEEVEEEGKKRERHFIWTKNPHSEKLYGMIPPSLQKKEKKR